MLQQLNAWKTQGKVKICVGVDLGGSGIRTRISNAYNKDQFLDFPHMKAKSTKELINSLMNIQSSITKTVSTYESCGAAIAVAGPIKNDKVVITNWPGNPELRTFSLDNLPQKLFPKEKTLFMNDLEAGAYGIIAADDQKILDSNFIQLWQDKAPKGPIVSNTRTAVMALGSGLGVALIVKDSNLKRPLVLPCELGHVQVPPVCQKDPNSKEEYNLLQFVSDFYHKGRQMPEFEDLSSGRGIRLCYKYFLQRDQNVHKKFDEIDAGKVAMNAQKGDKTSKTALFWCYKLFLRLAKQIGTTLQCDSIVMALDNQVKNAKFVEMISDQLSEEFYNFIRPDWMSNIRVYSQTKKLNFNVLGCEYKAHQINSK